jgi:hypothetical protein
MILRICFKMFWVLIGKHAMYSSVFEKAGLMSIDSMLGKNKNILLWKYGNKKSRHKPAFQ